MIPKRFRMAKNGFTCSIRALFAFNGTRIFGRALTPYQMAKSLGPNACVVWDPYGGSEMQRFYAMLAHSEDRDRSGILYLEAAGSLGSAMYPPCFFSLPMDCGNGAKVLPHELKSRRFILSLNDPSLFKDGHYVVIWPPQDILPLHAEEKEERKKRMAKRGQEEAPLWALLDPWRVDGKAVAVTEKQLDLLLAGTDHVIFLR